MSRSFPFVKALIDHNKLNIIVNDELETVITQPSSPTEREHRPANSDTQEELVRPEPSKSKFSVSQQWHPGGCILSTCLIMFLY